jgi:hypothetical protein
VLSSKVVASAPVASFFRNIQLALMAVLIRGPEAGGVPPVGGTPPLLGTPPLAGVPPLAPPTPLPPLAD